MECFIGLKLTSEAFMNDEKLCYVPPDARVFEQDMINNIDNLSCHFLKVLVIQDQKLEIVIKHQTVFGEEFKQKAKEDISANTDTAQRFDVLSFCWNNAGRETCLQVGFFENGVQLACSASQILSVSEYEKEEKLKNGGKTLIECFLCFTEGSLTDNMYKFHPSIGCLLCLLNRMKSFRSLNNFQLEIILLLFQQYDIKGVNELMLVRSEIDSWIASNLNCVEDLFSNMSRDRWENQSNTYAFFSLAFYDIARVTRNMLSSLMRTCSFDKYERFFNIVLSAMFGNEMAISELEDSRSAIEYYDYEDPEIVKILNELNIKYCPEKYQPNETFPKCLLERPLKYHDNMDPRSICFLPPQQFKKSNLTQKDFAPFLFGRDYYITYLHKMALHTSSIDLVQELKSLDMSIYYYALAVGSYTDLNGKVCENAGLAVTHGFGRAFGIFNLCPNEEEKIIMRRRMNYLKKY